MTTTLDDLIARLVRSREAAGRDLPVRIVVELHADDDAPDQHFVSVNPLRVRSCVSDDGLFIQIAAAGANLD